MNKPEDISHEAWDAAGRVRSSVVVLIADWISAGMTDVAHGNDGLDLLIARAIMAAKAEEREACAAVADKVRAYLSAEHAADPTDGPFAVKGGILASTHIAAAIRKRSEA